MISVMINGRSLEIPDSARGQNLLDYLRETLHLTGPKNGCGIGVCGSCTVLVNGKAVQACRLKVNDTVGATVVTIEGFAQPDGTLHPLQQAFIDHGAIQCGFCTPGMVLAAHAFLLKKSTPTRAEIRRAISPNLCRCTGYQQIIDAIEDAARYYADGTAASPPSNLS
jgi:carbon-monoxide dehydrogenase small subunit